MPTKILTVDDSLTVRLVLAKAFATYDAELIEACNGEEGLAAARRDRPDLILLDLSMPIMDGIATLKALRADPHLKSTPPGPQAADQQLSPLRLPAQQAFAKPHS